MLAPAAIAATLGLGTIPGQNGGPDLPEPQRQRNHPLASALTRQLIQQCTGERQRSRGDRCRPAGRHPQPRREQGLAELIFGTVYPFSMHSILLHRWFGLAGIDSHGRICSSPCCHPSSWSPESRPGSSTASAPVRPWNALAVHSGSGIIVHAGIDIVADAPEKVLVWRAAEIEARAEPVAALNRAIVKASHWCADPANWAHSGRRLVQAWHSRCAGIGLSKRC